MYNMNVVSEIARNMMKKVKNVTVTSGTKFAFTVFTVKLK